jgi:hypothetical protein
VSLQRNKLGPLPDWSQYAAMFSISGYDQYGKPKTITHIPMPPPFAYFWLGKDAEGDWPFVRGIAPRSD